MLWARIAGKYFSTMHNIVSKLREHYTYILVSTRSIRGMTSLNRFLYFLVQNSNTIYQVSNLCKAKLEHRIDGSHVLCVINLGVCVRLRDWCLKIRLRDIFYLHEVQKYQITKHEVLRWVLRKGRNISVRLAHRCVTCCLKMYKKCILEYACVYTHIYIRVPTKSRRMFVSVFVWFILSTT